MSNKTEISKIEQTRVGEKPVNESSRSYLVFKNSQEKEGENGPAEISLSSGEKLCRENLPKFEEAFKRAAGIDDMYVAMNILSQGSHGLTDETSDGRLNQLTKMMAALEPKDAMESILFSQFLALRQSALRCLRRANSSESFYHTERYFALSAKLMSTANATFQTILKYRTGGNQTFQVVHIHDSQAIVAQNLSPADLGGGAVRKNIG